MFAQQQSSTDKNANFQNAVTPVGFDPTAPLGLEQALDFRKRMLVADLAFENMKRYRQYVTDCQNQARSIDIGRALADPAKWPQMPYECGVSESSAFEGSAPNSANEFPFADENLNGPRRLNEVDPINFKVIALPEDHSKTSAQLAAETPADMVDIGNWNPEDPAWYPTGPRNTFHRTSTPNGQTPPTMLGGQGGPADDGKTHVFQFYPNAVTLRPGTGIQVGNYLLIR